MSDNGDEDLELVMPFVTVASAGGVHDDAAYVAGFEMGSLDARLHFADGVGADVLTATIRVDNIDQAELIAMKHGFVSRPEFIDNDWVWVQFRSTDPD